MVRLSLEIFSSVGVSQEADVQRPEKSKVKQNNRSNSHFLLTELSILSLYYIFCPTFHKYDDA